MFLSAIQQVALHAPGAARRGRRRGRSGELNVHELDDRWSSSSDGSTPPLGRKTSIVSFGFKHGIPLDVDLVFDCRFLPNPHWVHELRLLTGLDLPVRDYVLAERRRSKFAASRLRRRSSTFLLPAYAREGKSYLSIAIGCTGGHHRSVRTRRGDRPNAIRGTGLRRRRSTTGTSSDERADGAARDRPCAHRGGPRAVAIGGGHGLARDARRARAPVRRRDHRGRLGRRRRRLERPPA